VLSESLENLQDHGVVERTVIDDKPVRVEYSLTPLGKQLELALAGMEQWGERYLEQSVSVDELERIAEGRDER
jgi:DNA-binding HxlR family transcriptional regulator